MRSEQIADPEGIFAQEASPLFAAKITPSDAQNSMQMFIKLYTHVAERRSYVHESTLRNTRLHLIDNLLSRSRGIGRLKNRTTNHKIVCTGLQWPREASSLASDRPYADAAGLTPGVTIRKPGFFTADRTIPISSGEATTPSSPELPPSEARCRRRHAGFKLKPISSSVLESELVSTCYRDDCWTG